MHDPLARLPEPGALAVLSDRIERARVRRAPLAGDPLTTAYRLVNADGDGLPGLTLDRHGDVLVLSLYADLPDETEAALVEAVAAALSPSAVYLKRRPREARRSASTARDWHAPVAPAWGEARPELEVGENGARFLIRPGGDLSVGLFLDMRDTRAWIGANAEGRTVLNTFAYTCGFSISARLGRAERVLNLDLSRRALEWGERNHRLNSLPARREDLVSGDVFNWLERLARRGAAFGMVVLDPPSFASWRAGRFSAAVDYDQLALLAARVVEPGGLLVAACNHAGLDQRRFRALVERGLAGAGRSFRVAATLAASPLDFPAGSAEEPPLKVLALEL